MICFCLYLSFLLLFASLNCAMSVHLNIRKFRENNDISRTDMSKLLGLTLNGYGKIERGEVDISIKRLYEIAEILKLSVLDFFDEKDSLLESMTCSCKTKGSNDTADPRDGGDGFDSQMYIEYLEQRILWLKIRLGAKFNGEED